MTAGVVGRASLEVRAWAEKKAEEEVSDAKVAVTVAVAVAATTKKKKEKKAMRRG